MNKNKLHRLELRALDKRLVIQETRIILAYERGDVYSVKIKDLEPLNITLPTAQIDPEDEELFLVPLAELAAAQESTGTAAFFIAVRDCPIPFASSEAEIVE